MPRWLRATAGAALAVSVITLLTRVIGFLRWLVFSPTVGAGVVGTAYQAANQVPNILYEVVAGGALAGAVVPLLAAPIARSDRADVNRIASALLTWSLALTVPLAVIVAVFHQPLATVIIAGGAGADPAAVHYAGQFLLIFAAQLPLYAIGAVLTGVLQAHRRFLWPAFMPLLSSLVVIGTYLAYGAVPTDPNSAAAGPLALLAWGTTAGVVALALPLWLPTAATGVKLRLSFSFPAGVAQRAVRLGTAGMTALIAQQVAILSVLTVSNRTGGTGVFVLFNYIQAVYMLPYAVLAVPIATVVFPRLSRQVAEAAAEVPRTVATTTAAILIAGGLGAAILASAAVPLQQFFTAFDAASGSTAVPFTAMSTAILAMALAVPGWCLIAWAMRMYAALESSRYAAIGTTTGWLTVIAIVLIGALIITGTAPAQPAAATLILVCLGHAVGMSAAGLMHLLFLRRAIGPAALQGLPRTLATAGLSTAAAAGAGYASARLLLGATSAWPPAAGAVISGLAAGLIAVAVMGGLTLLLNRSLVAAMRQLAGS
ncbi:murein biosynthesis integral membrane protein MurJ [Brevibacterium otitidis]|uniref:Murein biosynthesis integral membrane protein MurJ n=1 Tax=Brevibacterium otitidis TaxID=53364 RepID=A0ABV5X2G6_9MICO|nr:lipid II flippase MurJ [Brevibacterium otitidis]